MAWLQGLAGKAEEVLNNIDRSTAAVLKKEDVLIEVKSLDSSFTVEEFLKNEERYSNQFDVNKSLLNKVTVSAPATPAHRTFNLEQAVTKSQEDPLEVSSQQCLQECDDGRIESSNQSSFDDEPVEKEDAKPACKPCRVCSECQSSQERINTMTSERTRFIREISDLTSTLEKTRLALNSVESELEQHRARAFKSLQERDKLISELRSNSQSDDSSVIVELDQLRQERDTLREENLQDREKLRVARQEAMDAELNAEKVRQRAMEANIQARESINNERKRRLEAEEDAKLKSEELHSLREEFNLRQKNFLAKYQKQESEISRLRSQLSAAATPNSEVESRLSSLTRTLVLKQQELEHLTTDRNALRLQLEKLEHEYQNWRKTLPYNSINDTDDAKASLPSFLMESPFDTGVARRVKRAYSTLDAVGIRIGVFLRRYPLARIFVIIYMALLQFWVLIVLFSQSPEAR